MSQTGNARVEARSEQRKSTPTGHGHLVPPQPGPLGTAHAPNPKAGSRARPRLHAIDGLRLMAALMVAVHHYIGTFRVNEPESSPWGRSVEEIFPDAFPAAAFGWIGVEIFFVISGFVICMSCWGRRPRDFFVSRVVRLYPAYWFAVLLTTAVLAIWPVERQPLPPDEILLNLSMLHEGLDVTGVDDVYWTLWAELRFYLLFLLVMATGLTYRKVVLFCCIWGFVAAIAVKSDFELLVVLANPEAAWFFIAGLTLYLMYRFGPDLLLWSILGMSWVMAQHQLVGRVDFENVSSYRGAVIIYTGFLALMAAIALGYLNRVRGRWLTVAGSLTYPYYLVHYAIGLTAIHLLHDHVDARVLVLGLIAAGLAGSWLIHRLIERPVSRILKKRLTQTFAKLDAR